MEYRNVPVLYFGNRLKIVVTRGGDPELVGPHNHPPLLVDQSGYLYIAIKWDTGRLFPFQIIEYRITREARCIIRSRGGGVTSGGIFGPEAYVKLQKPDIVMAMRAIYGMINTEIAIFNDKFNENS